MSLYLDESKPSPLQRQYKKTRQQLHARLAALAKPDPGIGLKPKMAIDIAPVQIIAPAVVAETAKPKVKHAVRPAVPKQFERDFIFIQNSFRGFQKSRVNRLINIIARHFRTTSKNIKGPCREKELIAPRFISIYLVRTLTNPKYSLPEIGRIFGRRDHTSILHGYNKAAHLRSSNAEFDELVKSFETIARGILGDGTECNKSSTGEIAGQSADPLTCTPASPETAFGSQFQAVSYFRNSRNVRGIASNNQPLAIHEQSVCDKS